MNPPIRKRRTRRIDSEESDFSRTRTEPSDTTAEPTDTESQHDNSPDNTPQVNVDQAIIDRIRSEIQEEQYHHSLDEPDYSNDSHDWDDEGESTSSDYWHFLGRYE